MANQKFLVNLDLNKNQLLNVVAQNLAVAPENAKAGQFYFDTAEGTLKWYTGTAWSSGKVYTFGDGLTDADGHVTLDQATVSTYGGVKLATNSGRFEDYQGDITDVVTMDVLGSQGFIRHDSLSAVGPITYDELAGIISAEVDSVVTQDSENLVSSGAVFTAIANALVGGVKFQGSFDASAGDYAAIADAKQGDEFAISAAGVVDGVDYNVGDLLLVVNDNPTSSADVVKIDNTEASDIVRLEAEQTLTNKTISAEDNTISGLTKANFAEGVVVTELADATDDEIPTAKAVAQAIQAGGATAVGIKEYEVVENPRAWDNVNNVYTWTIDNPTVNEHPTCTLYDDMGELVIANISSNASTITVEFNSDTQLFGGEFKLVVMGIMK